MNKETFQGKWHEFKGKVKTQWGKLTDDDIKQIDGKREQLLGRLEQRYGFAKEKAEAEVRRFEESCGCSSDSKKHTTENQESEFAKPGHSNRPR